MSEILPFTNPKSGCITSRSIQDMRNFVSIRTFIFENPNRIQHMKTRLIF
ncbi:hypothetical protein HanPI659440_Chr03g0109791 [Helianthus annuus]|nr:hypothetical protein HanPI659440_Chr03g0109791 [Helianthus annuus]